MTIRFISIFSLSVFHWYKRKSCRNTNIEGYFHDSSKWSLFSKIIVSSGHSKFYYKSILCFWKVSVFGGVFPFVKKCHFMQKSVSFWPNEWIFKYSNKIMLCKLWSKVTSVFLNINFCAKMSILSKNNWSSVRNVDFLKLLCTTTESEYPIGKHAYFQKNLTFCVNVFIH